MPTRLSPTKINLIPSTQTTRPKPSSQRLHMLTTSPPRSSYLNQKAQIFATSIPATCSPPTRAQAKRGSHDRTRAQWCDDHVRLRAIAATGVEERPGLDKVVRDEERRCDDHVGFGGDVRCFGVGEDHVANGQRKATHFANGR